ncbi:hypothetical protein GQ53DRAFT_23883 [Thozetella sp. PMI_491]|nr:hypothetical protein GQ53DRAFT_23883 [Thozetella sp. PMI_491]
MMADSSVDPGTKDQRQSPIACEACRQRKRKCDRLIPVCTQCTDTPSRCKYPSPNKRGIPVGYVSRLERRLAETEAALYRALLRNGHNSLDVTESPDGVKWPDQTSHRSKDDLMHEWDRLPLDSAPGVLTWYHHRSTIASGENSALPGAQPESPMIHNIGVLPDSNTGDDDTMSPAEDFHSAILPTFATAGDGPESIVRASSPFAAPITSDVPQYPSSKAEALVRSRKDLYF